jgi:hypothetical protein
VQCYSACKIDQNWTPMTVRMRRRLTSAPLALRAAELCFDSHSGRRWPPQRATHCWAWPCLVPEGSKELAPDPPATPRGGMSSVTMLPVPITARVPMRPPGRMTAFEPIQTWPSVTTGCDSGNSVCVTTSVLVVGPHEVLCPRWRCPGLHEAHRRADDKLPSARLLVAGGQRALA